MIQNKGPVCVLRGFVVVFLLRLEQMAEVPLAKHNDMVSAIRRGEL